MFDDLGMTRKEVTKPINSDFPFGKYPLLKNNIFPSEKLDSQNQIFIYKYKYV